MSLTPDQLPQIYDFISRILSEVSPGPSPICEIGAKNGGATRSLHLIARNLQKSLMIVDNLSFLPAGADHEAFLTKKFFPSVVGSSEQRDFLEFHQCDFKEWDWKKNICLYDIDLDYADDNVEAARLGGLNAPEDCLFLKNYINSSVYSVESVARICLESGLSPLISLRSPENLSLMFCKKSQKKRLFASLKKCVSDFSDNLYFLKPEMTFFNEPVLECKTIG